MARITPEEYARIKASRTPKPPAPAAAPPANAGRAQSRAAEEKALATESGLAAQTARQKRVGVDLTLENQKALAAGETFDAEVAKLNAEQDVKESAPPIYVGAFDPGLTTPLFGAVPPARPMNIAVPKAEAPGFFEATRPQVMAPDVVAAQDAGRISKVFDDSAFMQSIADLPPAEKQQARTAHSRTLSSNCVR